MGTPSSIGLEMGDGSVKFITSFSDGMPDGGRTCFVTRMHQA